MPFPSDRSLLRQKARSIRSELDPDIHEASSLKIAGHILNHPKLKQVNYVFVYLSYHPEVSTWFTTRELINRGLNVCIPLISGPGEMEARQIFNLDSDIEKGAMGISSPVRSTKLVDPGLIDLVLAPGLLFDRKGARIGYGGGYYDRFLKNVRPNTEIWGLCFNEQISEKQLDRNDWDQPMTGLITPDGFINTRE